MGCMDSKTKVAETGNTAANSSAHNESVKNSNARTDEKQQERLESQQPEQQEDHAKVAAAAENREAAEPAFCEPVASGSVNKEEGEESAHLVASAPGAEEQEETEKEEETPKELAVAAETAAVEATGDSDAKKSEEENILSADDGTPVAGDEDEIAEVRKDVGTKASDAKEELDEKASDAKEELEEKVENVEEMITAE